jgi:AcrR family transcriptional regulator
MTTMPKRDRLIEAAKTLFYQHGVTGTTLADIAERAKVPLVLQPHLGLETASMAD